MADEAFKIEINTQANTEGAVSTKKALSALLGVLKLNQREGEDSAKALENLSMALEDASESTDEFSKSQEKAGDTLKETTKETQNLRDELVTTGGVAQGVGLSIGVALTNALAQIPSLIKSSLAEYGEKEASEVRLQAALAQTGQAYGDNLNKLKSLADQMEILTNADGKQVLSSMSVASAMGISADQMEEVTKGAIGIATAFQMDLSTAIRASAAAYQGKTELLSRYISTLSECATEEEKLAMVQQASANGLAQAQAEVETFSGRMTALGHSVGALSESLGEIFVPAVESTIDNLSSLARYLSENTDTLKLIVRWMGNFATALATVKLAQYLENLGRANVATKALGDSSKKSAVSLGVMARSANIARGAMYGLATSVKAFMRATLVLGAVALVFEVIYWAIDKVKEAFGASDKAQQKHQKELDKTAKKNQELAQAEIDRLKNTTLSESEYTSKKENNLKALKDAQDRLLDAQIDGLGTSAIEKEIALYKQRAEALDSNIERARELARLRAEEADQALYEEASLQKKKLIAQLDFDALDDQSKLNKLLEEEKRLTWQIAVDKHEGLYTSGQAQMESAKLLENSIKEKASVKGQIQALRSKFEAEKEIAIIRERDLAILKAKAQGDNAEVARLERINSEENLRKQYKSQGIKSDDEALSLARQRLDLEEQITNAQIAQTQAKAKEEFLAEYKIKKARADGDETLARSLELQKDANALANRLGIEYNEALNALRALEKAEEERNNKNKKSEKKVEYDEKDVAFAKKIVERGARGSTGQKAVDQAQAIVDGKEIEGQEYAMFSGAKKRSKVAVENDSQIDDKAYSAARKLGSGNAEQNLATSAQGVQANQAQATQQAQGVQASNAVPTQQVQSTAQPAIQQPNQAQPTEANAVAESPNDSPSKDSGNAEIIKALSEVVNAVKDLSKKLDSSNEILSESQSTLDDILITAQAEYQ